MTTVSGFSRQNDTGLRVLNVVQWENLVLVVVLVLESKGPYYGARWWPKQMAWLKLRDFAGYIKIMHSNAHDDNNNSGIWECVSMDQR